MKARIIDPLVMEIWSFDCITSESADDEWEVTEFPVETGLAVTDHIQRKPVKLVMEGILTDSPLDSAELPFGRAKRGYEAIISLAKRKTSVLVVAGYRIFANMVITSVSLKRSPTDGDALLPTVTLREVEYVTSLSVPIPPELLAPAVAASAQSAVDAGTQSASGASADVAGASSQTLAKSLVEGLEGGDLGSLLAGGF